MATKLDDILSDFVKTKRFKTKGPLCVALVVTQHARDSGLPLDPDRLVTGKGGQVSGLGKSAVQKVLAKHGITRVLASEGGRTSRGSIDNMRVYVELLNDLADDNLADLDAIEEFWIRRVHDFFAGKPFKIRLDTARSLRNVIKDVIHQAEERQRTTPGTYYAGSMLQHLVGAKLDAVLGPGKFEHNSSSTSDEQTGRAGDFFVGDSAIHVTTSPGEAVIERCRNNLDDNYRPIIVTTERGHAVAQGLAENMGLDERIDILEVEQFLAGNLHELGGFEKDGRVTAIKDLISRYNEIIDEFETDPSLKIEFKN
jgi:hypothetical protein